MHDHTLKGKSKINYHYIQFWPFCLTKLHIIVDLYLTPICMETASHAGHCPINLVN